ncbi:MAG TPA: HEAT repeat domain-containing protein, partial [Planctomycetota bacterium]|nr:HEAT repeat domain-containing protein [Planctomycetota bacterium]
EERRMKLLRGYTLTSLYLPGSNELRTALVSALGHTDAAVIDHALRALGRHGGPAEVPTLVRLIETPGSPHRGTALCALAAIDHPAARAELIRMLDAGMLDDAETMAVLRITRATEGGADVVARIGSADKALWRTASRLTLPPAENGPKAELTLNDRTVLHLRYRGLAGDAVVVADPAPGLSEFRVPIAAVSMVHFAEPQRPTGVRVFLIQGSLLTGQLVAIDPQAIKIDNGVLGQVTIPRAQVQGILFAPDLDRLIGASPTTDRVRRVDNSLVDAEVLRLTPQGLVVRGQAGDETLPLADVAGVLFKRPAALPVDATLYSRIVLRGGDRVLGHIVAASPSHLGLVLPAPAGGDPLAAAVVPCQAIATIEFLVGGGASWGYTMIADYSENRLIEVDEKGREVFTLEDVFGAWDVECLDNGNLLVTEFSVSRVQEVTRAGKPVWAFEDLKNPYDADRLPNGNTLIADTFGNRVIEVDPKGRIVWVFANDIRPFDADRLPNGNTLIADVLQDRVIEVTRDGQIAWELRNLKLVHDADRLPNGNTLITLREAKRVIEVDRDGVVVFELKNLNHPSDADRLPNGNTLVAENGMVREFDRAGNEVWRREVVWAVEANRY